MQKISDIIPFLEKGYTVKQIAKHFNKSIPTINVYIRRLKDNGFNIKVRQGRPPLAI